MALVDALDELAHRINQDVPDISSAILRPGGDDDLYAVVLIAASRRVFGLREAEKRMLERSEIAFDRPIENISDEEVTDRM